MANQPKSPGSRLRWDLPRLVIVTTMLFANGAITTTDSAVFAQTSAQVSTQNSAPAPAASLPDWRGVWSPLGINFSGGSGGPTSGARPGASPNPFVYTAEYQAKFDRNLRADRGDGKFYDPTTNCEPPGMPRQYILPSYPIEFLVTPHKVVVLYEYMAQVRQIYTDGRQHPPDDELTLTYNGHSIGHWEGQVLVVDTVGFKDSTLLDRLSPHSDAMRMKERIRRTGDQLTVEVTLTDSKALIKPWSSIFTWEHKTGPRWDLKEFVCAENNRNPSDETGKASFQPPQPKR
jgi:hypothetical protein